jgi:Ca2+-binding EF-hand superfamily protein
MGSQISPQALSGQSTKNSAFGPKELYNLKQVYFFLCLHTTTLTSCPLDRNQFHSLFGSQRQYKPLWRALFNAIDLNGDNVIDFEEFLTFVTHLKRGDVEMRRQLCFRLFDPNRDGFAEKGDFRCISETKASANKRPSWQQTPIGPNSNNGNGGNNSGKDNFDEEEDEYVQFFRACDENGDGKFSFEDFDSYCTLQGEAIVNQTLKLLEIMFDGVIEETGIIITATDVKNSKPHIDWQDHKIGMGTFFCCSAQPPVFTTAPAI